MATKLEKPLRREIARLSLEKLLADAVWLAT